MTRVAVLHPDLGIGGAERLIVDVCRALQESEHIVQIFTGYHDKSRCFEETRNGKINVTVVGQWIPRTILGKCHAFMAYLKMMYIAFYVILYSKHDLVICDQVSVSVPVLKLDFRNRHSRTVFYCHFPDQLLSSRDTLIKSLYRKPLDFLEEWSTSLADIILVNSKFTQSVVKRTFRSLRQRELTILYPCVDVNHMLKQITESCTNHDEDMAIYRKLSKETTIFLSLNRFERKKNISLAILALRVCLSRLRRSTQKKSKKTKLDNITDQLHLVIAGGYDQRIEENVKHHQELRDLVQKLNLESHVTFVKSPNDTEKLRLLKMSHVIIYTPSYEHFGIVPLEAMAMSKPIVASATGGPMETVEHNETGFLCDDSESSFAEAMLKLHSDENVRSRMGKRGFERVQEYFSYEAFKNKLNEICFLT